MWLLISLVASALLCLFLAFWGFFGRFPDEWEWVAVVLSAVGLVMSSPTVFQMLWGRTNLSLRFDKETNDTRRLLTVSLENIPVKHHVLKKLGVRRDTIESLEVSMRLAEAGSGQIIFASRGIRIHSSDHPSEKNGLPRIALPPTFSVGAVLLVVVSDVSDNKAIIPANGKDPEMVLRPGYYTATLAVLIDGEPKIINRKFSVGSKADDLTWTSQ